MTPDKTDGHTAPVVDPRLTWDPDIPPSAPNPARRGWVWLIVIVAVLGLGAVYWFFGRQHISVQFSVQWHVSASTQPTTGPAGAAGARSGAGRPTPVVTAVARSGDLPRYLVGLGTVVPLHTVTVRTRVDGQLDSVYFVEGQPVHEGDLLAQIDPRPYQVQLEQAEGQHARDEASLKNARLDLTRYEEAGDAASQQQRDTAQATVNQYEGALKVDQAAIDTAKLQLAYCKITSPVTGMIGLRMVDAGNLVHASDANGLVVIAQVQPISVIFSLPQDQLPQIQKHLRAGEALTVEAWDRSMNQMLTTGTLKALDSQIDPSSGTIHMRAEFENKDGQLYPNQFVNARLLVTTLRGATLVPTAAVQRAPSTPANPAGTFIYVVKQPGMTAEVRNVTVGQTEGELAAIIEGIAPGEVVITDGVDKLQQGSKVSLAATEGMGKGKGGKRGGRGATTMPGGAAEATAPAISSTRPTSRAQGGPRSE